MGMTDGDTVANVTTNEMVVSVFVATDDSETYSEQMQQQNDYTSLFTSIESEVNGDFPEARFEIEQETASAEREEIAAESVDDEEGATESTGFGTMDFLIILGAALVLIVIVAVAVMLCRKRSANARKRGATLQMENAATSPLTPQFDVGMANLKPRIVPMKDSFIDEKDEEEDGKRGSTLAMPRNTAGQAMVPTDDDDSEIDI